MSKPDRYARQARFAPLGQAGQDALAVGRVTVVGCGAAAPSPSAAPIASPVAVDTRALDPRTPLTAAQRRWVDSTLASLTLRQRVGQMVMIWMLGDYTNTADTTFLDTQVPDPGTGFFYLKDVIDAHGQERGLGATSDGRAHTVLAPCPPS